MPWPVELPKPRLSPDAAGAISKVDKGGAEAQLIEAPRAAEAESPALHKRPAPADLLRVAESRVEAVEGPLWPRDPATGLPCARR